MNQVTEEKAQLKGNQMSVVCNRETGSYIDWKELHNVFPDVAGTYLFNIFCLGTHALRMLVMQRNGMDVTFRSGVRDVVLFTETRNNGLQLREVAVVDGGEEMVHNL